MHSNHIKQSRMIIETERTILRPWHEEDAVALNPGDVIDIPEGAKHWHGAQKDSWFQPIATHIATGGKESNEWLEAVSDEEYNKL